MLKANPYRSVICVLILSVFMALSAYPAHAANLPVGFTESIFASGLSNPTAMQFAPDGRLFVAQQGGALRVIENGNLLPTPFAMLDVDSSGERGLLGIAFDPNFLSNQFVYLYYTTASSPIHNRVSRFTANGNVAVPGSEVVIMDLENLAAPNHNGGAIHFGPDGNLYVAVGENGVGTNAQSLNNRLGKILRINPDGSILTDNPFFNETTGANRAIWALGLRNPFTFAFQPGTGRMFINDVGASSWEEINDGIPGANYGWPATEGETTNPNFVSPLFAYPHIGGPPAGCAIAGGAFYNPASVQFPMDYVGDYFFADLCTRFISRYDPATDTVMEFATATEIALVDLKVGSDGNLYYLARGTGTNTGVVYRVQYPFISPPPNTNLLMNGDFNAGLNNWGFAPDLARSVVNGTLETYRINSSSWGSLYQDMGYLVPSGAKLDLAFQMGNSSSSPKTVTLILHAPASFNGAFACSFTVPAFSLPQTYTMRGIAGAPWTGMRLETYLQPADNTPALQLDNLVLQYTPSATFTSTECSGSGATGLALTITPTASASLTATATLTPTTTSTMTLESTATATETPTMTETPTYTATETLLPSATFTSTQLPTETLIPSATPIPDTDGDTVPDDVDACPSIPAPPPGCPPTETLTQVPTSTPTETVVSP